MKRPGRKNVNNVEDKVAFRICNPAMLKSMAYLSDAEKGDNLKKYEQEQGAHCTAHSAVRGKAHFWEAPGCAGLAGCPRGSFSSCPATAFTPSTDILHNWSKKTSMIIFQSTIATATC